MAKPVMHCELLSKDPAKLSDFYEKVFDWKIQHIRWLSERLDVHAPEHCMSVCRQLELKEISHEVQG